MCPVSCTLLAYLKYFESLHPINPAAVTLKTKEINFVKCFPVSKDPY